MIKRWLVFDIGCIECREESGVVGTYATKEEADDERVKAAYAQSLNWSGQHYFETYDLGADEPEESHPEWKACK